MIIDWLFWNCSYFLYNDIRMRNMINNLNSGDCDCDWIVTMLATFTISFHFLAQAKPIKWHSWFSAFFGFRSFERFCNVKRTLLCIEFSSNAMQQSVNCLVVQCKTLSCGSASHYLHSQTDWLIAMFFCPTVHSVQRTHTAMTDRSLCFFCSF